MAMTCKPGGYTARSAVNDIRRECQAARRSLQELIAPERPGPAREVRQRRLGMELCRAADTLDAVPALATSDKEMSDVRQMR